MREVFMIPDIEPSYERIATSIISSISEDWSRVRVVAVFYPDGISWLPEYSTPTGQPKAFEISLEATRAIRELRRRFKEAGKPVWGSVCFELEPEGRFDVQWGYDNCDSNGDTIWDESAWKRMQAEYEKRLGWR